MQIIESEAVMRKVLLLILPFVFLLGCADAAIADRLAYQDARLYIDATFTLDGAEFPAILELEAAEYDESGRMLARDALLTLSENSIISGVKFEMSGGEAYVSSGVLKIPLADEAVIEGICDIVSLFCISEDSYYSSQAESRGGVECERAVYVSGENRVEVLLDKSTALPLEIIASIDGRTLAASIRELRTE